MLYLDLVSNYLVLTENRFQNKKIWEKTFSYLRKIVLFPAIMYRQKGIPGTSFYKLPNRQLFAYKNLFSRYDYKLAGYRNLDKYRYLYYLAFHDQDYIPLSIAANLYVSGKSFASKKQLTFLKKLINYFPKIMKQRVRYISSIKSGWLFQPGMWCQHPDYLYAGNTIFKNGLKPYPITNIAEDASHSARFPELINSMLRYYKYINDKSNLAYTNSLRIGLINTMIKHVLKKQNGIILTTNYMDGWNGLYRYHYAGAIKTNPGYGPYELSGTFYLGMWSLLGSQKITKFYQDICNNFPNKKEYHFLIGAGSTRARIYLWSLPTALNNGYYRMTSCLASKLG